MPQLIEGGEMGVDPAELGPRYTLTCPACGERTLSLGRTDNLAYDQRRHGGDLTRVKVPVACHYCDTAFELVVEPDIVNELILKAVKLPRGA
jgi:DNA-directed RNA polymerase subunit RPC12/RpoP